MATWFKLNHRLSLIVLVQLGPTPSKLNYKAARAPHFAQTINGSSNGSSGSKLNYLANRYSLPEKRVAPQRWQQKRGAAKEKCFVLLHCNCCPLREREREQLESLIVVQPGLKISFSFQERHLTFLYSSQVYRLNKLVSFCPKTVCFALLRFRPQTAEVWPWLIGHRLSSWRVAPGPPFIFIFILKQNFSREKTTAQLSDSRLADDYGVSSWFGLFKCFSLLLVFLASSSNWF